MALASTVPFCQVTVQHDQVKGIIKIAFPEQHQDILKALIELWEQDGGEHLPGTAPRGPLMRRLVEGLGPHWRQQ